MEKLGYRTLNDLENFLVESDGSLKDIVCGTLIKIPLGAGYVKYYKSQTDSSITLWINESLMTKDQEMNRNDEI